MNSKKKVSVIIAVHNGEAFLAQTLQSILKQTYTNFEIIVVINCSNDATKEIVENIDDERIKLYETNICQLAFNLNYGLYKSQGEYIARIDADDIAQADRLEKQLEVLESLECDVVGSNLLYIDEHNGQIGAKKYPQNNAEIRKSIVYQSTIAHPSVIYKKKTILEVGGYMNGKISEDYDLWIRLMRDEKVKFYNIQENLTHYRVHATQVKGNKYAYAEIAGYFLREALSQKSMKSFFGCIIYTCKALFK